MLNFSSVKLGYISQGLSAGINLLMLPFVLFYLPSSSVGIWYNFSLLLALVLLLDFGMSSTLLRHTAYAWAGAIDIRKVGLSEQFSGSVNQELLSDVFRSGVYIYRVISIISFIIISTAGSYYIYNIAKTESDFDIVFISWAIYAAAACFNIYSCYWIPILKGIGSISEYYKVNVLIKLIQLVLTILGLIYGYDLIAISSAYFISVVVGRFLFKLKFFKALEREDISKDYFLSLYDKKRVTDLVLVSKTSIFKQGGLSISNYVLDKVSLLFVTIFLGLEYSASYGLTVQAFSVLTVTSNVYYQTMSPKIINLKVLGETLESFRLFCKCLKVQFFIILLGSLFIITFAPTLISIFESKTQLLPFHFLCILFVYYIIFNFQLLCVNYLIINNRFDMLFAYILSGFLYIVLMFLYNYFFEVELIFIILVQLLILISYNAWKWPYVVVKDSGLTLIYILRNYFSIWRL
ncbi:O-unit flippase-like protein [Shewanella sp. 5_MG-2023]|uniref:O-unit flippase-like protein n=1 Tax=Shewanella sp. 5_MG-2023 TaxID=3062656 RepID=UPI0026E3946A|nr:O-unit flippase-like protein [Shewanella sp. 5_MG-2023]MDO6639188.1 O-unit flippase-like protein [Shewanella sp. 5_MG-2023]